MNGCASHSSRRSIIQIADEERMAVPAIALDTKYIASSFACEATEGQPSLYHTD